MPCVYKVNDKEIDSLFTFSMPSRPTLRLPGGHREDKENRNASASSASITMIHEQDDDEDGPILYRDDEDPEMEDEGKFPTFSRPLSRPPQRRQNFNAYVFQPQLCRI